MPLGTVWAHCKLDTDIKLSLVPSGLQLISGSLSVSLLIVLKMEVLIQTY